MSRVPVRAVTGLKFMCAVLLVVAIALAAGVHASGELPEAHKAIGYAISALIAIPSVLGLVARVSG